MTDYSAASHQQMYDYVNSGSWSTVQNEADLNTKHSTSVTGATTDLKKTLTKIQSAWEGAAADQFTEQTNSIVDQMHQHAANADNVGQVMAWVSGTLKWAQGNMPTPPSAAEQALADVNNNPISEWGLGIATGGGSYVASKAAQDDIAQKKATATQVMTQLASVYTQAQGKLQKNNQDGANDPTNPTNGNNGNGKGDQSGSGNGSSSGGGGGGASGGVMMPMPIAMPSSGGTGGGSGSSPRLTYGSPPLGSNTGTTTGSNGIGNTGTGSTSEPVTSGTVTSGLGNLPTSGTLTGGTGTGTGSLSGTTGGLGGSSGLGGLGGGAGAGGVGGLGGLGAGGLGAGGIGGAGEGSLGGYGSGSGSGSRSALSGGTGTGEMGGEEAGGRGYGSTDSTGSGSGTGTSAAAAAGEEGAGGATNEQGMMGGMGRGGAGGGQQERGGRATWLKEDPDYWYGDKMKNAAPPGGVIE